MPPAFEVLLLNTAVPQIQAAQSGDTYVVPRDIAFSAALTLSAGTANGVPYLNGSKVLTSGSALTFDGTNLGTGGYSGYETANRVTVSAVGTSSALFGMKVGGTSSGYLYSDETHVEIGAPTSRYISFDINGEQMRLTSTGLGIGTTSPGAKLDVEGTTQIRHKYTGAPERFSIGQFNASGDASINNIANAPLLFATNNTERMRLNSSGNLGIGTSSIPGRLTIGGYGSSNQTPDIQITRSSSGTAIQTGPNITFADGTTNNTTTLQVTQGRFGVWNYGAGSWQERLSVDASGNLLLNGTTAGASAVGTLAIFNGTAPTSSVTNGIILYAEDVSSSSELKVRDEAGNVTTLSPHNFSLIPEGPSEDMAWAYYSEKGGKRINVDMLKLARMVEKLTGEKLVYEN